MKVAFGLKAHSGWAALVVVGVSDSGHALVDRRRLELVEERSGKAPYHAAEELEPGPARDLVERSVKAAHRCALKEMRVAVKRERERRNEVVACAVLMGSPMPEWTTEEIRAVHFRMHKAEGMLFKTALARAAEACDLKLLEVPEKTLVKQAGPLAKTIAALGKNAGPPWGKDQKEAALAALVALRNLRSGRAPR
ncbi:MAG: hypothetical protein ACREAA_03895 [Candidatus Polarisedimenticolia bacterium]